MTKRIQQRGRVPVAVAVLLVLSVSGCFQNSYDVNCGPNGGAIELTWTADPRSNHYRVYRVVAGGEIETVGEVDGASYSDATVEAGTEYHYLIRPVGTDGLDIEGVGECSATAASAAGGPDTAQDLMCRAKSGKVDVLWEPVAGAISYRVLRAPAASDFSELAEIASPPFADLGVMDGSSYEYAVVSVAADGSTSAQSTSCSATPGPHGGGEPPAPVADLACRGKRDKVDLSWTASPGASLYRVFRNVGGVTTDLGEVANAVFVDFGLTPSVEHQYTVRAVAADGTESADSAVCSYAATDRDGGNRAPSITSTPLTNALERHIYQYDVVATDPEGGAVTLSTAQAPPGMYFEEETSTLTWLPVASQIGPHTVELRATDPQGAFGTQAFVVEATDFNEPPNITSVPVPRAQVGELYHYDVEAFDPESSALAFSFAEPPAAGMTIDAATGVVSWTPAAAALGQNVVVRATDAGGAFDDQSYALDATQAALVLSAPQGDFSVEVGDTLELRFVSNYPASRYFARPLPKGATQEGDLFRFTPEPGQDGRYDLIFKAAFSDLRDMKRVSITVTDPNLPPVFGALGPFEVAEGALLRFPVSATDPDGDSLTISAPALGLENAVFDEFSRELIFQPSYEQAGSYDLVFRAGDGVAAVETQVAITVTDAIPPVGNLDLVVNPPQSPTFVRGQTISGSVTGEVASVTTPAAALVTGLAPTNVQQGRPATIVITGRNTSFVQGDTTATFGEGVTVDSLAVMSPTQATANVSVSTIAPVGIRQMRVRSGGQEIPSVVAFRVEPGAAIVRGILRDAFTGQPLVGVRVTVNGTNASGITGANGSFEIVGVPAGAQTLVAVAPNFEVLEYPVTVEENVTYELDEPIGLAALARPAQPGGSLPRAQTLASIIDRGISAIDEPISQEQAELLISDTMIAVGVDQLGVLDENGQQLNPNITGPGMLSLTPLSVRAFAGILVRGNTYTLGQLAFYLQGSFGWVFPALEIDSQLAMLQDAANKAWEHVGDPGYALPLAIFNPGGTALSTQPPILTRDTRFNSFQSFLLVSSFIVRMFPVLDMAFDRKLEELGIDPSDLLRDMGVDSEKYGALQPHQRPGGGAVTQLAERVAGFAGVAGDLAFGAPAYAQGPGTGTPTLGGRFANGVGAVWSGLGSAALSGAVNIAFAAAVAGLCAVLGVFGPIAALSLLGTFLVGFATTLIAKFVGGFLGDPNLPQRYTPQPPALISQVDPTLEEPNFYLRFRRAANDLEAAQLRRENPNLSAGFFDWMDDPGNLLRGKIDKRLLEHRYALWKFTCNPDDQGCKDINGASTAGRQPLARDSFLAPLSRAELDRNYQPVPDPRGIHDPIRVNGGEFEQFRVLKTRLSEGSNYFKIQTIQYYRRIWNGIDTDGDKIEIPYKDVGIAEPFVRQPGNSAEGLVAVADVFRGNGLQESGKLVRRGLGGTFLLDAIDEQADAVERMRIIGQRAAIQEQMERALFTITGEKTAAVGVETIEKEASEALAAVKLKVDGIKPRIEAHATVAVELDVKLREAGVPSRTVNEVIQAAEDVSTPGGTRLKAALEASPGARPAYTAYVSAKVGEYRIGLANTRHNDTVLRLRQMRTELATRFESTLGQQTFPAIDLAAAGRIDDLPGRLSITTTVGRSNPPRQPFVLGEVRNPAGYEAALARIDGEIATQEADMLRLNNHLAGTEGSFKADLLTRTNNLQNAFWDESVYASELEEYELKKRKVATAQELQQLEREAATAETRLAAVKRGFRDPAGPRGFKARLQSNIQEARIQRASLTKADGYLKGIKGSFGLNTGNVIGVATEVGTEIHGLRSGIDILTSDLSPTIVVHAHTLPPDPTTGQARIQVTTAPLLSGPDADSPAPIPIASLFDATSEPELPQFALGLARGPLARLFQAPMAIDDAGNTVLGPGRRAPRVLRKAAFTGPAGLPIQFETDPDSEEMLGVLYPSGPPPGNPRDGFLFRDFPFSPGEPERFGAGFPSELIAVDSDGRVYLENYNSNEEFGGRIFRYQDIPAVREHVGSIQYFSQTLMYAHPAFPVAMEIGDVITPEYGRVEDLFVANKDLGVYFDQSRSAVNRVLRVPVHQVDRIPFYANGQNRNRAVGQPWAEHPDFAFEGPVDIESDARDPATFTHGTRPLYMSDGDSLYVMRDTDHDGSADTAKIAEVPGRVFSGIASDTNGHLYVADYAAGEVYLIPQQLLDDIVAGVQPIFTSDEDLDARAFLIKVDLDRPGDVELDTYEHRYVVSTPGGLEPFDIPLVGRLGSDIDEIQVDALGSAIPVTTRRDRGNMFMMGANSEGTFAGKEVRIRVRRVNDSTGASVWDSFMIRTQVAGASILRDDALEQQ